MRERKGRTLPLTSTVSGPVHSGDKAVSLIKNVIKHREEREHVIVRVFRDELKGMNVLRIQPYRMTVFLSLVSHCRLACILSYMPTILIAMS